MPPHPLKVDWLRFACPPSRFNVLPDCRPVASTGAGGLQRSSRSSSRGGRFSQRQPGAPAGTERTWRCRSRRWRRMRRRRILRECRPVSPSRRGGRSSQRNSRGRRLGVAVGSVAARDADVWRRRPRSASESRPARPEDALRVIRVAAFVVVLLVGGPGAIPDRGRWQRRTRNGGVEACRAQLPRRRRRGLARIGARGRRRRGRRGRDVGARGAGRGARAAEPLRRQRPAREVQSSVLGASELRAHSTRACQGALAPHPQRRGHTGRSRGRAGSR
mmetsp:Transcript_160411/g.514840  ORF Transcript_160411/g.514840 Transcript_160411/m.514840 type:complete len:275 (+) Transcript_160411:37-861(+)